MNRINAALTCLADLLLAPFASMPLVGLLLWSAVTGLAMTYVFGKTSNQRALRRAADRSRAQLLAIRLFKDNLSVTLGCQIELFKATSGRLLHSLLPMMVMLVPIAMVLIQLALRYEHRPLWPGESTVVALQLAPDAWSGYRNVELVPPRGVAVETPALRDAKDRTIWWRIRADSDRSGPLRWQIGDERVEFPLAITALGSRQLQPVSVHRPGSRIFDRFLHPGEPGFASDARVSGIDVAYPRRATPVFGLDVPWWMTYLIVSMLVALVVHRRLGVQF